MDIADALREWQSKKRHMGCVSATNWFCKRVAGFKPKRIEHHTVAASWDHVVATNGEIDIDLAPYANKPDSE
jgi:hypothetical protein